MSRWILACLLTTAVWAAPPKLDRLRCEYLADPVGIDIVQPRLSWQLVSDESGQRQSAYQVQVASSPELLARGRADRWDSGRVASSQSTQVVYAGQPLTSRARCWWRVRIWDRNAAASAWSQPARWSMGLLAPSDWSAKWIGSAARKAEPMGFGQAAWIWYPETNFGPDREAPAGTRLFRRRVSVPADTNSALLAISADDQFQVAINDKQVARSDGQGDAWRRPQLIDLTGYLQAGDNVVAVQVSNGANERGNTPAGLLARLVLRTAGGATTELITDPSWKTQRGNQPGWRALAFDDAAWPAAVVQAKFGEGPWGAIAEATQSAGQVVSPMLRTSFQVAKPVRAAELSICGLGYHELYLDGQKVGDHVLDPAITQYDKRSLYVTHDVTAQLRPGRHALGVQLGNGEYNQWVPDAWSFQRAPWLASPRLRLQLDIELTDGTRQRVVSDGSWKQSNGPLTFDLTRLGVDYDARLEQPGWATAAFDDKAWQPAALVAAPTEKLSAQRSEPIKVMRTMAVAKWTEAKPGVWVADFGQNLAGYTRLSVRGPAGTTITLRHGERRAADGTVDQKAIAEHVYYPRFQEDRYTLAGRGTETFETRFAFHGFQYVEVTGLPAPPTAATLQALQARTAFDRAGSFSCSNELLNRIEKLAEWSYESNFVGFPTDCPHREKNGWTGDAQLACEMGLLHYRGEAAYTRWLDDLADAQRPDGKLPCISPTPGWGYNVLDGPAWEGAYVLIPWWLYEYRGDLRILADHYPRMAKWVDFYAAGAKDDIVTYGLGDWCPWKTQTPSPITSTGYMVQCARIVARTAGLLGRADDQKRYEALAERLAAGFNKAFYNADAGTYGNGGQTSLSCALYQDVVPAAQKPRVVQALVDAVAKNDGHLDVGILGSKYLLRALSDNGRADVAYQIASQSTQPSWGWWLGQGATTMWETWGTGASLNHIMFGDISAWFIEYLAGIRPDPAQPGFQHFLVRPMPVGDLTSVHATHDSPYGRIVVEWERHDGQFQLNLSVPPNSSASVWLPGDKEPREVNSGVSRLSCKLPDAK